MKKLLVLLSALLMLVAVSCSNDNPDPYVPSTGHDLEITVPEVDPDNIAPDGYLDIVDKLGEALSRTPLNNRGYTNAYNAEGVMVFTLDYGVYTIGVSGDLIEAGSRLEWSDDDKFIIINGTEYDVSSETGMAYIGDWEKIQESSVREVGSNFKDASTEVTVTYSVPGDNGELTYDVDGNVVTETVTSTVNYKRNTLRVYEYDDEGNQTKLTPVMETIYELSQPLSGITSITIYGSDEVNEVLEVVRDGETHVYAYPQAEA